MGCVNNVFASLLVFERHTRRVRMFNSAKNSNNQLIVLLYGVGAEFAACLKNSLNGYGYSLCDIVGLDITKLKNFRLFFNMGGWGLNLPQCNRLTYYNLLDYKTTQRVVLASFFRTGAPAFSLAHVYYNANWCERELVEFFGAVIPGRADTRNLLLDYNLQVNPLLKTYPTEGHQELFFNYLSYNLEYVATEFVEL